MLRFRFVPPALLALLLLPALTAFCAEGDATTARLAAMSTDDLVELIDQIDFTDPFESNFQLALQALSQLNDRDIPEEQRATSLARMAVYHLRTGDPESAMADIDAAIRIDAENPEYLLMKGSLLFDSGKPNDGKIYARKALMADPELVDAQQSYAKLSSRAHVAKDDWSLLNKSQPLLTVIVHPYLKSATGYFKSGDYRAALARIEDYLRIAPYDYQVRDDANMIYVLSSAKMPATKEEPKVADVELVRRAVMACNLTKAVPHRVEILKTLVRAVHFGYAGKSPGTVLALSDSLLSNGKLNERGLASVHYVRAKAFAGLGRFVEATTEIDQALQGDPNDADTRALKVEYLTCTGQYSQALAECDAILKQNPGHVSTLLLKAQICTGCPDAKFRDPKAAVKLAAEACEATGKNQRTDQFNPYKMLVLASAEAGDFNSAGEAVKQLRYSADSVQDVKEVERLADHVRSKKPWKLEPPTDNSKLPRYQLLYQQLSESLPNLQLTELQVHYESLCDELLKQKELTESERIYVLRRRAQSRFWQGKLDSAIADIEDLLKRNAKDYSIYVLLNRALLEKGDTKGVAALSDRLVKTGDGSHEYRWANDVIRLETELNRVDRADFKTPQERQALVEKTGKDIDRMIQQTPQQPILYQLRATNRFQRGDYAAALEDNLKCLDLAPYRSRVEFANVIFQQASILEKLCRFDHALQYSAMTMQIEGKSERSRQLTARVYRAVGKHQLASFYVPAPTPQKVQPAVAETVR